jgi:hypothetical protein
MVRKDSLSTAGLGALIMKMTTEKSNQIIKDLITKYPKGPDGRFKRADYHMEHVYHDIYERYTDVPVLYGDSMNEIPWFGYDPLDLFSLNLADVNDCRNALRFVFEDESMTDRALVRRARVLFYRVRNARNHILKVGAKGVYELRWGWRYNSPKAYVHASNHGEAKAVGLTLNGIFGAPAGIEAQSTFLEVGEPVATLSYNNKVAQSLVASAKTKLQDAEKALEHAQSEIKNAQARAEIIMTNAMMQANLHEVA